MYQEGIFFILFTEICEKGISKKQQKLAVSIIHIYILKRI